MVRTLSAQRSQHVRFTWNKFYYSILYGSDNYQQVCNKACQLWTGGILKLIPVTVENEQQNIKMKQTTKKPTQTKWDPLLSGPG